MRIVYQAENLIDAQLVHDALSRAGIPAHVAGGLLTGAAGELPVSGLVTVRVPASAFDDARHIVREVDAALAEARAAAAAGHTEDIAAPLPGATR